MAPAAAVRGMMAALTRDRLGKTEHRVVKLDAWHALAIDQLAALFPEARRAFVFRDAAEVLVSQARRPGLHVVPGHVALDAFGVTGGETITAADYPAWVLDRICRAASDAAAVYPALLLIDYVELPGAVTNRILPHFGIAGRKPAEAMAEASVRDTKSAGKSFTSDGSRKRAEADGPMRSQPPHSFRRRSRAWTICAARRPRIGRVRRSRSARPCRYRSAQDGSASRRAIRACRNAPSDRHADPTKRARRTKRRALM